MSTQTILCTAGARSLPLVSGGVEDVSFLFYARHIPTGDDVTLKYTDLGISSDFKLIEKLVVRLPGNVQCPTNI